MPRRSVLRVIPYHLIVIFLILATGIGIAGYLYHSGQEAQMERDLEKEISAFAHSKANEISIWRKERMSNAGLIFETPFIRRHIGQWLDNPASVDLTEDLRSWMTSLKEQYGYESVLLVDAASNLRLSIPEATPPCSSVMDTLHEAERIRKPFLTEIHRSSSNGQVHIALVIPILDPREPGALPLATLILQIDPRRYLYTLLQYYPSLSETSEAFLVRREGDEVVFLSDLRHRKDTALSLRLPLSDEFLPAARVIGGEQGAFRGIDYRGAPVFAAACPVPDSSWFLVAKIDSEEVYSHLRKKAWLMALLVSVLIAAAAVSVGLIWRHQRVAFYRGQWKAEREKLELVQRYEYLTRYANDILWLTDTRGRIVEANERAVRTYGYTREELLRLSISDMRTPETLKALEGHLAQIREQDGFIFETVHRRKDGTTFPVEVSSRVVELGDSSYFWSIMRDISERKHAEEQLRESENTYKTIFENTGTATLIIDEDASISLANKECENFSGYSKEELPQKIDWKSFVAKEELEKITSYHSSRRMDPSSVPSRYETRCVDRFGNIKDVFVTVAMIPGTTKSVASLLDITETKRMERALRESEEKFSKAFRSSPSIITFTTLKDGTFVEVNESFTKASGYERDEVLGKTALDLDLWVNPRDRSKLMELIEERGIAHNMEVVLRRRSGDEFIALLSCDRVELKGEPCLLSVISDITELKRAEEALRESERRFREVLENIRLLSVVLDDQGKITFCNDFLLQVTGSQREELLGQNWFDLSLPPDVKDEVRSIFLDGIQGGGIPAHYQNDIVTRSGKRRTISWNNTLLRDAGGKVIGVTSIGEDISERSLLENRLRQAQKMEAMGTLAGGIAHDFNNILGAIMGFTELSLYELPQYHAIRQNLEQVLKSTHRAKDLIKQILTFSRMRAQEHKPVEVGLIIKEALNLLRASLPSTIEIRRNISVFPEHRLLADPTQIHQLLINLCTNAGHAMRETGGLMEVSLHEVFLDERAVAALPELEPGFYFKLMVNDTGHGIHPATRERIFDPFFTTKGPGEGTGMGLAVVHGIVNNHKGAIEVDSEPGRGSAFTVYLPSLEGVQAESSDRESETPRGKERILFVDDEEILARMGQRMLEKLGYQVVTKMHSREAFEAFRAQPDHFDLVITDYTMPQMTGTGLAQQMMHIRPDIPIILCTGYSEMISKEKAVDLGIREFVMKPVSWSELAEAIRRALD